MKCYYCVANNPEGVEIAPRSLTRVQQGKYWVPDCVDYQAKFNLPRKIKSKEVFAGWSCHNCKSFEERLAPSQVAPQKDPETSNMAGASRAPEAHKASKTPKDPD